LTHRILIAGAGIGGLAAALACAQRGMHTTVIEAAAQLGEAGAGIQLGPHAMKVLQALKLTQDVSRVASTPESILIADAVSGKALRRVLLGETIRKRCGQTYVCLHRGDLHQLLRSAAHAAGVQVHVNQALTQYEQSTHGVRSLHGDLQDEYDALIGADGLWSQVRAQMLHQGAPRSTGHAAFRTLIPAQQLPHWLRTSDVRLWWAKDVHVVCYPLGSPSSPDSMWNVVVLAEVHDAAQSGWSLHASHAQVMQCFERTEPALRALLDAAGRAGAQWKRWNLFDREPLAAAQMAQGRVALLGDAAHPMLPYLAQGAAMAIEDAWVLAHCLSSDENVPQALNRYAQLRAARNARVVRVARRNGRIFHLGGAPAWMRNTVLSLQGEKALGMRWLYDRSVVEHG
jgi:salicylate hydroxylase